MVRGMGIAKGRSRSLCYEYCVYQTIDPEAVKLEKAVVAQGKERRVAKRYGLRQRIEGTISDVDSGFAGLFCVKHDVSIRNVSSRGIGVRCDGEAPKKGRVYKMELVGTDGPKLSGLKVTVRHVAKVTNGYLCGMEMEERRAGKLIEWLKEKGLLGDEIS